MPCWTWHFEGEGIIHNIYIYISYIVLIYSTIYYLDSPLRDENRDVSRVGSHRSMSARPSSPASGATVASASWPCARSYLSSRASSLSNQSERRSMGSLSSSGFTSSARKSCLKAFRKRSKRRKTPEKIYRKVESRLVSTGAILRGPLQEHLGAQGRDHE